MQQQYDPAQLAILQQQQFLLQSNPAAIQTLGDYKYELSQQGQLFMHAY